MCCQVGDRALANTASTGFVIGHCIPGEFEFSDESDFENNQFYRSLSFYFCLALNCILDLLFSSVTLFKGKYYMKLC